MRETRTRIRNGDCELSERSRLAILQGVLRLRGETVHEEGDESRQSPVGHIPECETQRLHPGAYAGNRGGRRSNRGWEDRQGHNSSTQKEVPMKKAFDRAWQNRGSGSEFLRSEVERLQNLLNSPNTTDFFEAVKTEVAHQKERWGRDHDRNKMPADWYWTLGYLGGKALHAATAGDMEKARHHCITAAALCAQWHESISESLPKPAKKIERARSPEADQFWEQCERTAKEVESWPEWKKFTGRNGKQSGEP